MEEAGTMHEGVIKTLTDKGFGFIEREGEEKDLFFHSNALLNVQYDELREGDRGSYQIAEGPKGLNAVEVSKVS